MADSPDTVDATIPSRLLFQSLTAISPRRRNVTVLPAVVAAHRALVESLAIEAPSPIIGYAGDRFDLLERAGHIKSVLDAVGVYIRAVVKDGRLLARYLAR
jgi:hypothetical protein